MNVEEAVIKEVDRWMDNLIDRIFELSQQNLITPDEKGRVKADTGHLLKSGNVNRKVLEKEIVYNAPYSDVVEFGRTAGHPVNPEWLHKWVRRKLGIKDEAEVKRAAWAIAKAIEKRGIAASPYLRRAAIQAFREFGVSQ